MSGHIVDKHLCISMSMLKFGFVAVAVSSRILSENDQPGRESMASDASTVVRSDVKVVRVYSD